MKKYEVLFADLDGTLIDTLSGKAFPEGIWDMKIKFGVLDKIKELAPKCVLIVTNQGGIEKGFINEWSFRHKLEYICAVINNYCGCETYARYCTVNDVSNVYRKPNTGMLEHLMEQYVGDDVNHIKSVSVMIGDASGQEGQFSDSDKKCAENFGIDYIDVDDFVNIEVE